MPTPTAWARIRTSPAFGSGTGTSRHCSTLGEPGVRNWMSFMASSAHLRDHLTAEAFDAFDRVRARVAAEPQRHVVHPYVRERAGVVDHVGGAAGEQAACRAIGDLVRLPFEIILHQQRNLHGLG